MNLSHSAKSSLRKKASVRSSRQGTQLCSRKLVLESLQKREMLTGDLSEPMLEIRLEAVHPITKAAVQEVQVGGSFLLRGVVDDLRSDGEDLGVFAAYADVHFEPTDIKISGPISYGDGFLVARSGDVSVDGQIKRIGAVQPTLTPPGGEPQTLFEVLLTAQDAGTAELVVGATNADLHSQNLLFGNSSRIEANAIRFVSASINAVEDDALPAPVAVSDGYSIAEDTALNVSADDGVLSNDFLSDSSAGKLYASSLSQPQHGTLSLNSDGSFHYVPNENYSGPDSFQYVVFNDGLASSAAKVVIDVSPVDDSPVAQPDRYIFRPGSTLRVTEARGLLANDREVDGQELSVKLVDGSGLGFDLMDDGSFTFSAPETASGNVVFEYELSDGQLTTRETVTFQPRGSDEQEDWGTLGYVINQRLAVVDSNGNALDQVPAGGEFFVEVYAQDLRETPGGVFSAFLDLSFEGELATALSPISYGEIHKFGASGAISTGFIDELGAFSGSTSFLDGNEYLIARVPFKAQASGTLNFAADPADDLPKNEPLLYGENLGISPEVVRYGEASVEILDGVLAQNDTIEFPEDVSEAQILVLANDASGKNTDKRIVSVSPTASGARVSIAPDGLSVVYTGAPDYFGTDAFTYIVEDSNAHRGEATVSIQIANLNDDPEVVDDSFLVGPADAGGAEGEQQRTSLDVLANDSSEPDIGESLVITEISDTSGLVTISDDGRMLHLNHGAGAVGTRSFSYTVADGNGGIGTATVTISSGDTVVSEWQNPENHLDVSNDGVVSPMDALIVINRLNRELGAAPLTDADSRSTNNSIIYMDTNGDRFVSPVDVLNIVNYLNALTGEGEPPFRPSVEIDSSTSPISIFVLPEVDFTGVNAGIAEDDPKLREAVGVPVLVPYVPRSLRNLNSRDTFWPHFLHAKTIDRAIELGIEDEEQLIGLLAVTSEMEWH